jgi:lipoprotein Spr/probable lipoprotein NlpC
MLKKYYRQWLLIGPMASMSSVILIAILVTGCSGPASVQTRPHMEKAALPANGSNSLEQRLRSEVREWVGTPHRMGGETRRGIDCSGFVQRMYKDIFQHNIPRSTSQQVRAGQRVDKKQLRPGDLVFFKIPYKGRHVGIYLGRKEFAHASTSKGVMISSLGQEYWSTSYWTARRYPTGAN